MFGRRHVSALVLGSFFWATAAPVEAAPEGLSASGSIRTRYEALTGQFRPGFDDDDDSVVIRTRLFAEYDTGPIRIGGELIDSRAYDTDPASPVSASEVNALEPVQAYIGADLGAAFGAGSAATFDVGRFVMDVGSRRLVADDTFRNTTNGFTGARFGWAGKGKKHLQLFFVLPQTRLPSDKESVLDNEVKLDRESFDLTFWGAFVSLPDAIAGVALNAYVFGLDEDDSLRGETRNRHLITPGVRLFREPSEGGWDFEIEGVYQFGTIRTGTAPAAPKQDVSAAFLHVGVGRQLAGAWTPRLSLEFDYATGDRSGGNYSRFDTLYGSRSSDFGPTGIYGPLGRANIVSPALRLQVADGKRWEGQASYRAAWLETGSDSFASTGVRDPAGVSGRFAGHQIEARVRYWLLPKVLRLETGAAVLLRGRFLQEAPNAAGNGDTVYGYSDLTFSF